MRSKHSARYACLFSTLSVALALPATAVAYVGPGAGLSIIGSLLAFVAAVVVGIFGFLWFPIRRIIRKRKQAAAAKAEAKKATAERQQNDSEGYQARLDEKGS